MGVRRSDEARTSGLPADMTAAALRRLGPGAGRDGRRDRIVIPGQARTRQSGYGVWLLLHGRLRETWWRRALPLAKGVTLPMKQPRANAERFIQLLSGYLDVIARVDLQRHGVVGVASIANEHRHATGGQLEGRFFVLIQVVYSAVEDNLPSF